MHTSTFCGKVTLITALCCDMCQLCIPSNAINPSQKNMSAAFWIQLAPSNLFNFHHSKGTNLLSRERNFQFSRNHIKSLLQQHQTKPPEITEHRTATPQNHATEFMETLKWRNRSICSVCRNIDRSNYDKEKPSTFFPSHQLQIHSFLHCDYDLSGWSGTKCSWCLH